MVEGRGDTGSRCLETSRRKKPMSIGMVMGELKLIKGRRVGVSYW